MKESIHVYSFLLIFTFAIIIIVELLGLSINYKKNNEINSLLIEIIETNDGIDDKTNTEIDNVKRRYPDVKIEINRNSYLNNYNYEIVVYTNFKIKLINLNIPIVTNKYTRMVKI